MVELPYTLEDLDDTTSQPINHMAYNTEDTDMKTRLSILVAVLCSLAYYSYTDGTAASNQFESS